MEIADRTNCALTALGDTECHSVILNIAVETVHVNVTLAHVVAQKTRQINSQQLAVHQFNSLQTVQQLSQAQIPKLLQLISTMITNATTATNSNGAFTTLASLNARHSMVHKPTRFVLKAAVVTVTSSHGEAKTNILFNEGSQRSFLAVQ